MTVEKYVEDILTISSISTYVLRVYDYAKHDPEYKNILLIPEEVKPGEVHYKVVSEDPLLSDSVDLYPNRFIVIASWKLKDLVAGAMWFNDSYEQYFESEV